MIRRATEQEAESDWNKTIADLIIRDLKAENQELKDRIESLELDDRYGKDRIGGGFSGYGG
jgi:hypothetical protein